MTRVLLVDDNDRQRKLSCALLEDAGYIVEAVPGAAEALHSAREQLPDVILSDVMMDHIDGFGLCRRLQEDPGLAAIPVVLVSAHYDDPDARELAVSLGASALIARTPDFSAELEGVATCLGGRARPVVRRKRDSYEAHLASNAKQLTKLLEQTQRAEQRWRTVFEQARDTLTILTTNGVIVEANQRWEEVLGIAPGELIGRHIRELAPAGLADSNHAHFRALVEAGESQVMVPLRHANGSTVLLEISSCLIDIDGEPHVISVGRDVTEKLETERRAAATEAERRRLEERLAHAQRLETIGQLTGSIAHDFNNVLSAILSSAELLIDDLGPQDARVTDAQEIRDAARRAAALTERLLGFSRRQVVELVDLDVASVVRAATRMLRRLIGGGIQMRVDEDLGVATVRADALQLEQVIVNLAINARDAMPNGGVLTIATSEVHIEASDQIAAGDYVLLAVTDTGTGMSLDTQRHLFEPFFTTKERGRGTGLGLSTAHGIVKQLGGDITVSTELGRGTTMRVYLPRVRGERPRASRSQAIRRPRTDSVAS